MNKLIHNRWFAAGCGVSVGLIFAAWVMSLSANDQAFTAKFDVMIESGDAGPKAHPCATDPNRDCFTFKLERK